MNGRYLRFLGLIAVSLILGPDWLVADGLPEDARKQVEQRYRESKGERSGTILVVVKEGIPAALDAVETTTHVPLFGRRKLDTPGKKKKAKQNAAEVEIRNGTMEVTRTSLRADLLDRGTLLVLDKLEVDDDHIELSVRTHDPLPDSSETFQLYKRARLKFYFDRSTLNSGDLHSIFETIEFWFKAFDGGEEARQFSKRFRSSQAQ